ncbi:DUF397 domain-containing protein [Streptomyces muensis]|uniref:DUF397 domain-containing protein n=1 Tax=Streptomyces muensis TaxID=1077944 RepID=A0A9X1Q3Y5_STRM4|nr:DUF397 domain-containing protein [Streptomyces muensis]MCF1598725.1 DUF397 domain-containing protein [Streptomyces muensis]
MGSTPDLVNVPWRKSSYSGNTGGECVECAPLGGAAWRKSSYSGSTGGECVEVANLTPHIAIRDSKNPDVGTLTLSPEAYVAFVGHVGASR